MASKVFDTTDLIEALEQHEGLDRQRFQYLCDQLHELLNRLTDTPADQPLVESPVDVVEAPRPIVDQAAIPAASGDPSDFLQVLLGAPLAAELVGLPGCEALLAGFVAGQGPAMALVGQLLLFRSAPAERYPQLLKEVGEAFYGWRTVQTDDDQQLESALVAWLVATCSKAAVTNTIERVQVGDRFDATRHQSSRVGSEVAGVHGWVVLRENGKVYTRAAVTAR